MNGFLYTPEKKTMHQNIMEIGFKLQLRHISLSHEIVIQEYCDTVNLTQN